MKDNGERMFLKREKGTSEDWLVLISGMILFAFIFFQIGLYVGLETDYNLLESAQKIGCESRGGTLHYGEFMCNFCEFENGSLYMFECIYGDNSNTYELTDHLFEKGEWYEK